MTRQPLAQLFAGVEELSPDGVQRDFEDVGDLAVFVSPEEQDHDEAHFLRQLLEGLVEQTVLLVGQVLREGAALLDDIGELGDARLVALLAVRRRLKGDDLGIALEPALTADPHAPDVRRDAKEPSTGGAFTPKAGSAVEGLQEGLLDQVSALFAAEAAVGEEDVDPPVVELVEPLEFSFVHRLDNRRLDRVLELHRVPFRDRFYLSSQHFRLDGNRTRGPQETRLERLTHKETRMTQPASKSGNDPGQGDTQGSKTGMGIEIENAHALLIGVGRCQHAAWSLPVTTLDVQALSRTLADPDLCRYPKGNIRVLSDEAASREGILAELAKLAQTAAAVPDSTVFVYYSGHGWRDTSDSRERYFLIPSDVDPDDLTSSALSAEDFIHALRSLRSQRVLVMMDTCHAAAMADAKEPALAPIPMGFVEEPLPKAFVNELGAGEGRAVFLSCRATQKSWIPPSEGSLSIFTHHLVAGLQGAGSAAGARVVTVSSLMGYLGAAVPESARRIGREQTPFFKFETEELPVALIRGGKGEPAVGKEVPAAQEKPAGGGSTFNIGSARAKRDVNVAHEISVVNQGTDAAKTSTRP